MSLYEAVSAQINAARIVKARQVGGMISTEDAIDRLQDLGMDHDRIMSFLFDMVPARRPFWRFWGPRSYVPRVPS